MGNKYLGIALLGVTLCGSGCVGSRDAFINPSLPGEYRPQAVEYNAVDQKEQEKKPSCIRKVGDVVADSIFPFVFAGLSSLL